MIWIQRLIDHYDAYVDTFRGPHVENTSELGSFKITKEQSSSAGVRRIKAVIGNLSA